MFLAIEFNKVPFLEEHEISFYYRNSTHFWGYTPFLGFRGPRVCSWSMTKFCTQNLGSLRPCVSTIYNLFEISVWKKGPPSSNNLAFSFDQSNCVSLSRPIPSLKPTKNFGPRFQKITSIVWNFLSLLYDWKKVGRGEVRFIIIIPHSWK